jgi:hypothetical protein
MLNDKRKWRLICIHKVIKLIKILNISIDSYDGSFLISNKDQKLIYIVILNKAK